MGHAEFKWKTANYFLVAMTLPFHIDANPESALKINTSATTQNSKSALKTKKDVKTVFVEPLVPISMAAL